MDLSNLLGLVYGNNSLSLVGGGLFSFFYGLIYKVDSFFDYLCSRYPKGFGAPLQLVRSFFCQPQSKIYAFGNFLVWATCLRRHFITSLFAPAISILLLGQKVKHIFSFLQFEQKNKNSIKSS